MIAEGDPADLALITLLSAHGPLLNTPMDQLVQVQIQSGTGLRQVAEQLRVREHYLVTVVANDEQELEDRCYKIYYVFSHSSEDRFVIIEYLLEQGSDRYCSIFDSFPAVEPFEREMHDMVGLRPATGKDPSAGQRVIQPGSWLHEAYPPGLFPLRRTKTTRQLRERANAYTCGRPNPRLAAPGAARPTESEPAGMALPVGPIHAGIIESGQFWFATAGETIETLQPRLGYTHRGIERMFQSYLNLIDGWCLAEQVSGDTSFAHSLAYCRAAEVLTDTAVPLAAELLRALFLELERIHNHVADIGGLAEDVGMDQFAAEFAVVREQVLCLNKQLTGHRYLRSVNRVGGVKAAGPPDPADVSSILGKCIGRFGKLATSLIARSGFRERTIRVGILNGDEALRLGATGLVARASGIPRDSRLGHPVGVYRDAGHILQGLQPDLGDDREAIAGDVFARTLVRAREVLVSQRLIEWLAGQWSQLPQVDQDRLAAEPRVLPENNYTSAIGYAEGCRGDVVYWLMQDKMNGIYRCKVRDPSMLNWPTLPACVLPREQIETLIADFPLINKSFSLSYAGNDL